MHSDEARLSLGLCRSASGLHGHRRAKCDSERHRGAIGFFSANRNGDPCASCHSGDLFTDERHHAIGIPQFGPGADNPNGADFGRENRTGNSGDRFRFRTPSLLNIALTAPYGHAGAFESLRDIVDDYDSPRRSANQFFDNGGWCSLDQFADVAGCRTLYPNAEANTDDVLDKVDQEQNRNDPDAFPNFNLSNTEVNEIVAFLNTLTDPCLLDRDCFAPWIPAPEEDPDGNQLNAVDDNGDPL